MAREASCWLTADNSIKKVGAPEKLKGRKLFIVARNDGNAAGLRIKSISSHYAKAPEPKKLVILEGSAHAQFLFETPEGPRLLNEIRKFLSEQ